MEPSPGKEGAGGKAGLAEGLDRTDQGPEGALWENSQRANQGQGLRPEGPGVWITKALPSPARQRTP